MIRRTPRPGAPWALILIVMLAAAGCGGDSVTVEPIRVIPEPAGLAGAYGGEFPCANCPAIDVRLWLTSDHTFFLRQDYRHTDSSQTDRVHAYGRWSWNATDGTLVLDGRGPVRVLDYLSDGRLTLRTGSSLEHRLEQIEPAEPFADSLVLMGELLSHEPSSEFRECLTGQAFPIRGDQAERQLRRSHRRLSAPDVHALATVRAHFAYRPSPGAAEAELVVEQLISIRPKTRCAY